MTRRLDDDFLGPAMAELEKCDIDIEDIEMKILGLLMSSGQPTEDVMNDPTDFDIDSVEPEDQVAMMNQFIDIFAPEDEVECTTAELASAVEASNEYVECTGFDTLYDPEDFEFAVLLQDISSKCVSTSDQDLDECTEVVLGDNPAGNVARDMYRHVDKYCSCTAEFADAMPSCSLTVSQLMDITNADEQDMLQDFGPAYLDLKLSIGAYKKMLCAVGLGCNALEDICVFELLDLDKCLPTDLDSPCDEAAQKCAENDIFVMPPALAQGVLPDVCIDVAEKQGMTAVVDRYTRYNEKCNSEFSSSSTLATSTVTKPLSASPSTLSGPSSSGRSYSGSFFAAIFGVAVVVAVVAVAIRRRRARFVRQNFEQINRVDFEFDEEVEMS